MAPACDHPAREASLLPNLRRGGPQTLWPLALEIYSGQPGGPKELITSEEGVVMWEHHERPGIITARRVMPSQAEWATFWRDMEALDFWHWDAYYPAADHTGHEWKVKVTFPLFSHTSGGCNAYPHQPRGDAWQVFWRAVCLLAQPPTRCEPRGAGAGAAVKFAQLRQALRSQPLTGRPSCSPG